MKNTIRIIIGLIWQISMIGLLRAQWVPTNGPMGGSIYSLASSGTNIYVGTENGIYLSSNNGGYWTKTGSVTDNYGNDVPILSLFATGNSLFAGTGNGIFQSSNNGASWTAINYGLSSRYIYTIVMCGTNIFAGTNGGVFYSANYGLSWNAFNNGLSINSSAKCFSVIDTIIYVGTTDGVYQSTSNGTKWLAVKSGLQDYYKDISALRVSTKFRLAGISTGIYRAKNTDTSWSMFNKGLQNTNIHTIAILDTICIVGTDRGLYSSSMNDTIWMPIKNNFIDVPIWSLDAWGTNLFAGTKEKGVYLSVNKGKEWKNIGVPNTYINGIAAMDTNIFAGGYNTLLSSSNDGQSWNALNLGYNLYPNAIGSSDSILAAGTSNGIYVSVDKGQTWTKPNLSPPNVQAFAISGKNIYAGTHIDGVFLSNDNGKNWVPINNGISSLMIFALAASGNNILAATGQGVSQSFDGGLHWASIGPANIGAVVSIAFSGSDILAGTDYGIYRSKDNGLSWFPIGPNNSGFARAICVSGTNIIIGADFGVYSSSNDGYDWAQINTGLINNVVHCLLIRGQYIFAGTTSKGVWSRSLSEVSSPSIPILSTPIDGAMGVDSIQVLTWRASSGAGSYQVQVATDSIFTNTFVEQSNILNTSIIISGLLKNTKYYWHVNASNGAGTSSWSATQSFKTMLSVPDLIFLISPKSGSSLGADSVRLVWRKPASTVTSYEVELVGDSSVVKVSFDTSLAVKISAGKTEKAYSWRVRAKNLAGFGPYSDAWSLLRLTTSVRSLESTPKDFVINNYPNPFNPSTTFSFSIPLRSFVSVKIFDLMGHEMATVVSEDLPAGNYSRVWNASAMPSGMYFYRIQSGSYTETKRLILLR